jgi:uncharacterized protein YcfL
MRALPITAAAVAVALMLSGCHSKRSEPVPGPQSALMQRTATTDTVGGDDIRAVWSWS